MRRQFALLLLAAGLAAVAADRRAEIQTIVTSDGRFDESKTSTFVDLVLSKVLPADTVSDINSPWVKLSVNLIKGVLPDEDFFGADGKVVPPTRVPNADFPNKQDRTSNPGCGRHARLWIRMPFHDCGTYDKSTGKGGCNGSLRLEIPSADNPKPFGSNEPSASVKGQPHSENNGFEATSKFFESAREGLSWNGQPISWADTHLLGGILALWTCGGDPVAFTPGRVDASVPDATGMLPAPTDSLQQNLATFKRMGLSVRDYVVLVGGSHSVSAFARGRADDTPDLLDDKWAWEALAVAGEAAGAPPVCDMVDAEDFSPAVASARAQDHCALQFVVDMTGKETRDLLLEIVRQPTTKFVKQFSDSYGAMCNLGFDTNQQQQQQQQQQKVEQTQTEQTQTEQTQQGEQTEVEEGGEALSHSSYTYVKPPCPSESATQ